jgi:hypothetical protein
MDTASSNGPEVEPQPSTCSSLAFGVKVARNGRNVLEDAFAAQLDIACVTPVEQPAATPAPLRKLSSSGSEANPLSFFGVYDGHGEALRGTGPAARLHLLRGTHLGSRSVWVCIAGLSRPCGSLHSCLAQAPAATHDMLHPCSCRLHCLLPC